MIRSSGSSGTAPSGRLAAGLAGHRLGPMPHMARAAESGIGLPVGEGEDQPARLAKPVALPSAPLVQPEIIATAHPPRPEPAARPG